MDSMSVPILLALSDMSMMAWFAYSAAASVSPPKDWIREAEKAVACCMYVFADTPAVLYAFAAYSWIVSEASLNNVSTPPTSCSYSAYWSMDAFVSAATPVAAAVRAAAPTFAAVASPVFNLSAKFDVFLLASSSPLS